MAEAPDTEYNDAVFMGMPGGYDPQKRHDIDMMVRHMYDTMRWYGMPFLVRRLWTVDDFEAGLVERCSCYNENYGQPASFNCPSCYGYGFEGGFEQPHLIYATQAGNLGYGSLFKDKQGWREDRDRITIGLVADRLYREGDVIARVEEFDEEGNPSKIGDCFALNGKVKRQEEWGLSEPFNLMFGRTYRQVERLVSMVATCDLLLKSDSRCDPSFWGIAE